MNRENPKVIAFMCTWTLRKALSSMEPKIRSLPNIPMEVDYIPNPKVLASKIGVPVIRLQCVGRFEPYHAIKAALSGADSILIFACPPDRCSYRTGSTASWKKVEALNRLFKELGLTKPKVKLIWVEPEEQAEVLRLIKEEVEKAKAEVVSHG